MAYPLGIGAGMLEYQPKSKSTPNNPTSSQTGTEESAQPSSLLLQSNSAQSAQLGLNEGSWFSSGAAEKKPSSPWLSSWFGGGEETQTKALGPVVANNNTATGTSTSAKVEQPKASATDPKATATAQPKKGGPYTDTYASKSTNPDLKVPEGQLTFDAEGTEGGKWHSRTVHWPGGASGVTIGRGYDLGYKSAKEITSDFTTAGIAASDIAKFTPAAGKTGESAKEWTAKHGKDLPEITTGQQKILFDLLYNRLEADVVRISGNYAETVSGYDENKKAGKKKEDFEVNWATLHPAIKDLVVDLRYRGDYTPTTRKFVQPLIIANDLKGLSAVMNDKTKWSSVPKDRYDRRAAFMREAVERGTPTTDLKGSAPVAADKGNGAGTGTSAAPKTDPKATAPAATPQVDASVSGKNYTVTAAKLNVRSAPDSTKDNKVGTLAKGDKVTAVGRANGWLQIKHGGKEAWISEEHVKEVTQSPGKETPAAASGSKTLSGSSWYGIANQNGWANSTKFEDLESTFGGNAKKFVEGLRGSGAKVDITAGLRHEKRAILMHFAWHVAKGTKTAAAANAYCQGKGINIEWDHGDLKKTKSAAQALVNAFGLVHAASLTSNHMSGEAIDMKITGVPDTLTIGGKKYTAGKKGSGVLDEDKVDHIGKEMGVIWYGAADYVHWSKTGR